jgi:hypothetical protein
LNQIPFRASHHLLTTRRPPPDTPSLRFSTPRRYPSSQPHKNGECPTPLGSAPRLSQPLSGLRQLKLRGFVSCRNQFGCSPFRAFPSQRSWSSSEATSYLAVVLLRSSDVIARGLPADVSPTPASPRLPGSSSTRDALSAEQVQPSRSPQPQATRVSPPASLLCFVALFPPRVRSRRPKLPSAAGRCSLGVLPLQRPFRASEPRAHLQPHDWNSA